MSHIQKEFDNFKEIKNPWDLQHDSVNKNEEPSYIYVIILFSFSSYWCVVTKEMRVDGERKT